MENGELQSFNFYYKIWTYLVLDFPKYDILKCEIFKKVPQGMVEKLTTNLRDYSSPIQKPIKSHRG
jgi:hypothetical protein